ncbi:MAG TPA: molybdopterin molybdotransferase MoeA [Nitrososphaerales archaeon]|nr:molybdopterin molybdotransferase MoeA [Nitrososphaerales archaeon]
MTREIENYVSLGQAQEFMKKLTRGQGTTETVDVREAYGRVAAEDILSPVDVPDRPRSHMDGYAIAASDIRGASARSLRVLRLKGGVSSGRQVEHLRSGETMWVATGEYLPLGADSVAPVEETKRVGQKVVFKIERKRGDYCYAAGSDVVKGYRVIKAGSTIRAQDIGMLIVLGAKSLVVCSRPRIAMLATGSELTSAMEGNDSSKVRESHLPIFENLIRENGGEPFIIGIVPDDVERIASALEHGLQKSQMVLTLGGTSLGERDLVEKALRRVDKRSRIIHGMRMDRGRVSGVAKVKGKPVLMLPGPVQAAMNAFVLLGIPSIWRLSGKKSFPDGLIATLKNDWEARKRFEGFTKVVYVRLVRGRKGFEAHPVLRDTEAMSVLTDSTGYIVVPERTTSLRAGTQVSVKLLPGFSYVRGRFLNEG